ncbi:peroxidase family protein [Aspergillus candidus]|uniref:Cloroperoxidase n=1 Tax=Aspergillus candidus TaxID=41067 RepID=A0A2I2F264_ASPCN|nr:Cloroperoxidase [Aspergillus candidus]PLB34724.1 Cloroperoxidase [Aspergillus candidus]
MKTSILLGAVGLVASAVAFPQYLERRQAWEPQEWIVPGPGDSRGPCPGLNTLANHGYLPRNGKGITLDILKDGMLDGFNIEHADAVILFSQAIRTSPDFPGAKSFDLADLGRHGILEHDISLSRSDEYFADPNPFNETVWAETASYFTTPMITVDQLAKARMARLATSKKANPEHDLSQLADGFSWGECASFFEIMADGTTGTVDKRFIDYWFRNERMPTEIGWQRRNVTMRSSERIKYTLKLMKSAGV